MQCKSKRLYGALFATFLGLSCFQDAFAGSTAKPTDRDFCLNHQCTKSNASRAVDGLDVVADDSTSKFVSMIEGKSMVFDLPEEVADVMIGDTKIANAMMRSTRRAYLIATGRGQTSAYFFDAKRRPILSLNIHVTPTHHISELVEEQQIAVYRGADSIAAYTCNPVCSISQEASPAPPPPAPTMIFNMPRP